MTTTAPTQSGSVPHVHAHHHRSAAQPAAPATPAGSTAQAGVTPAATDGGLQKFASELQSILLSAQAGRASGTGSTASDPSAASDPAASVDPTASPSATPARGVADRLQALLAGGDSASAGGGTTGSGVQDVLDRLQKTLQQTLASYGSASATPATSISA